MFGDSGTLNGSKIIKNVVNQVIAEEFLSSFTWTGKTNVRNVRKLEMRKYSSLLKLIHETVLAADSAYTYLTFQSDMVKKVCKYAYNGSQEQNASG